MSNEKTVELTPDQIRTAAIAKKIAAGLTKVQAAGVVDRQIARDKENASKKPAKAK